MPKPKEASELLEEPEPAVEESEDFEFVEESEGLELAGYGEGAGE